MRISDLPTPGSLPNGIALTREVFRAINFAEIQHDRSGGADTTVAELRAFLIAVAELLPAAVAPEGDAE